MKLGNSARERRTIGVLAAILILALSCNASSAQKNKKGKTNTDQQDAANPVAMPPGSDADQIDNDIGEMLAGFQLGDVDKMHKYYADNVTFISGAFEPPITGWQNYVPIYQRQRAAFQAMQIVRRNTIIFPHGDVAWAMYQWEFSALLNGAAYNLRGQTTLVFNKVAGNWLIVHNHTSSIPSDAGQAQAPAQKAPAPIPAKP